MKKRSYFYLFLSMVLSPTLYGSGVNESFDQERFFVQQIRAGQVSAREAAEQFPYLEGLPVQDSHTQNLSHKAYHFSLREKCETNAQASLEWQLGPLKFEQYHDPQDHRRTLAVTDPQEGRTYYSQERYDPHGGPLVDVYFDDQSQVEYWWDADKKQWGVEHPLTCRTKDFSDREAALAKVRKWGEHTPSYKEHLFSPPWVLEAFEREDAQAVASDARPSLWTVAALGWLAASGDPADRLRHKAVEWFAPRQHTRPSVSTPHSVNSWEINDALTSVMPFAAVTLGNLVVSSRLGTRGGLWQKLLVSGGLCLLEGPSSSSGANLVSEIYATLTRGDGQETDLEVYYTDDHSSGIRSCFLKGNFNQHKRALEYDLKCDLHRDRCLHNFQFYLNGEPLNKLRPDIDYSQSDSILDCQATTLPAAIDASSLKEGENRIKIKTETSRGRNSRKSKGEVDLVLVFSPAK